jgi:tripartite-type tricarboxylate transporter receptor subunit TctC
MFRCANAHELGYAFVSETVHSVSWAGRLLPDVVKKLDAAFKKGTEAPEFKATVEKLYSRRSG